MRDTEKEAETQAEGEAGSMQGARRGTRSRVSRITPWAEGKAKPLGHPGCPVRSVLTKFLALCVPPLPALLGMLGRLNELTYTEHLKQRLEH